MLKLSEMKKLEKVMKEDCVKEITNDMNEIMPSFIMDDSARLIFKNGLYLHIVGKEDKYSLAIADYDGFFNWEMLNVFHLSHNVSEGCILTDDEDEIVSIIKAIEVF